MCLVHCNYTFVWLHGTHIQSHQKATEWDTQTGRAMKLCIIGAWTHVAYNLLSSIVDGTVFGSHSGDIDICLHDRYICPAYLHWCISLLRPSPSGRVQSIMMSVCLSQFFLFVCPHISETMGMAKLHQFFVHVDCGHDSVRTSGGVVISYALPVLWTLDSVAGHVHVSGGKLLAVLTKRIAILFCNILWKKYYNTFRYTFTQCFLAAGRCKTEVNNQH